MELFHHSRDVPATISKLVATLDRVSGTTIKNNPRYVTFIDYLRDLFNSNMIARVLSKGTSAEVQIALRSSNPLKPSAVARPIPLERFAVNKDMGRILIRRGGETIGAGESFDRSD